METQTSPPLLGTWDSRNLLTVPEVAEWARVHPKTVYRWIKQGRLEAIQFGPRTYRIPEDAVNLFMMQTGNAKPPATSRANGRGKQ